MRYYVDKDTMDFLEKDVEAVIYLLKKAYISTKEYYKGKALSDFLYFNTYKTFTNGYCFYFARMLKSIYKNAHFVSNDKYYAHISHIFIKIKGDIYDVYGKRNLSKYETLENEELEKINLNHMEVEREIYETFKMYFHKYLDLYINYNEPFIKKKHYLLFFSYSVFNQFF